VRVEARLFAEDGETVIQKFVLSDFVYDAALDPVLFDIVPPPGYTIKEDVIHGSAPD
jgi:hypothetical protein